YSASHTRWNKDGVGENPAESLFHLVWLAEYRAPHDPRQRTLLVGRRAKGASDVPDERPLEINIERLKVSLFPRPMKTTSSDWSFEPTINEKVYTAGTATLIPFFLTANAKAAARDVYLAQLAAVQPAAIPTTAEKVPSDQVGVLRPGPIWKFHRPGAKSPE